MGKLQLLFTSWLLLNLKLSIAQVDVSTFQQNLAQNSLSPNSNEWMPYLGPNQPKVPAKEFEPGSFFDGKFDIQPFQANSIVEEQIPRDIEFNRNPQNPSPFSNTQEDLLKPHDSPMQNVGSFRPLNGEQTFDLGQNPDSFSNIKGPTMPNIQVNMGPNRPSSNIPEHVNAISMTNPNPQAQSQSHPQPPQSPTQIQQQPNQPQSQQRPQQQGPQQQGPQQQRPQQGPQQQEPQKGLQQQGPQQQGPPQQGPPQQGPPQQGPPQQGPPQQGPPQGPPQQGPPQQGPPQQGPPQQGPPQQGPPQQGPPQQGPPQQGPPQQGPPQQGPSQQRPQQQGPQQGSQGPQQPQAPQEPSHQPQQQTQPPPQQQQSQKPAQPLLQQSQPQTSQQPTPLLQQQQSPFQHQSGPDLTHSQPMHQPQQMKESQTAQQPQTIIEETSQPTAPHSTESTQSTLEQSTQSHITEAESDNKIPTFSEIQPQTLSQIIHKDNQVQESINKVIPGQRAINLADQTPSVPVQIDSSPLVLDLTNTQNKVPNSVTTDSSISTEPSSFSTLSSLLASNAKPATTKTISATELGDSEVTDLPVHKLPLSDKAPQLDASVPNSQPPNNNDIQSKLPHPLITPNKPGFIPPNQPGFIAQNQAVFQRPFVDMSPNFGFHPSGQFVNPFSNNYLGNGVNNNGNSNFGVLPSFNQRRFPGF